MPAAILLTHHHADHIGGTAELLRRWPGLPVFAPDDDRIDDRHAGGSARATRVEMDGWGFDVIGDPGPYRAATSHSIGDGQSSSAATRCSASAAGGCSKGRRRRCWPRWTAWPPCPATPASAAATSTPLANAAFARVVEPDNAGAAAAQRGSAPAMRDGRRPTLPSTLADERACNPFLRIDAPAVRAAVAVHAGRAPATAWNASPNCGAGKTGFAHDACARAGSRAAAGAGPAGGAGPRKSPRRAAADRRTPGGPASPGAPAAAATSTTPSAPAWPIRTATPAAAARAGATISPPRRDAWPRARRRAAAVRLCGRCPARGAPADRIRADPVRRKRLQARRTQHRRTGGPVADDRGDRAQPPCADPRGLRRPPVARGFHARRRCVTSRPCTACSPATGGWR